MEALRELRFLIKKSCLAIPWPPLMKAAAPAVAAVIVGAPLQEQFPRGSLPSFLSAYLWFANQVFTCLYSASMSRAKCFISSTEGWMFPDA